MIISSSVWLMGCNRLIRDSKPCPILELRCPALTQRSPLVRSQDGNGQKATPGGIFPCAIDGADSCVRRAAKRMCEQVGRSAGPGRPVLWRLKPPK
jgi:hypothetical protein